MPVSRSQRLKKAAAKAVKRKAIVAEKLAKARRELRISRPRHIDLAASPLAACLLTRDIESLGGGTLTVARKLSLGRYATAVFSLDLWCLGVKDAYFQIEEADQFDEYRKEMEDEAALVDIEPARARLLLRDSVAYGESNGFPPLEEFFEAARLLSDVEAAGEPFTFGDHGRPHYVVGEFDLPQQSKYVVDVLTEKFGPGGFDVTYPLEEDEEEPA